MEQAVPSPSYFQLYDTPRIVSVMPVSAPVSGGTVVTITGIGLVVTPDGVTCSFAGSITQGALVSTTTCHF